MKYVESDGKIIVSGVSDFSLKETFDCGQCFRWEQKDNKFEGIAFGKRLSLYMDGDTLIIENTNLSEFESVWFNYFDFGLDYEEVKKDLSRVHPLMPETFKYGKGIRILHQEPWETLCSFIISQNNNIPRIKGIISRLCENFGEKIEGGYTFPSSDTLARLSEEDLSPLRCGFRAKYIIDASRKVASGEVSIKELESLPIQDARALLQSIKGVGPKVAECVLLYGFHRLEAFPLDVWMKRVMHTYFPDKSPDMFGNFAGIAQQYLFHYSRMHPEDFKD